MNIHAELNVQLTESQPRLGPRFAPYLAHLVPAVLSRAAQEAGVVQASSAVF